MRQVIAAVVVASLAVGPVAAQVPVGTPEDVTCSRPAQVSVEEWAVLTDWQRNRRCEFEGRESVPHEKGMVSPITAMVGVLTIIAGVGVILHPSEDTYTVLDSQYCVGSYRVDAGGCGSPMETRIGLLMIAGGAALTFIGGRSRRVQVNPYVSHTAVGVSGTVQWGESRGRAK